MTSDDWAGLALCVVGAAFLLNLLGCSRRLAKLTSRPRSTREAWIVGSGPRATWQYRMLGLGLLVASSLFIVVGDTS